MKFLTTEIKELRLMNDQVKAGTISPEEVIQRLAIYTQTEKRARIILQAAALEVRYKMEIPSICEKHNSTP